MNTFFGSITLLVEWFTKFLSPLVILSTIGVGAVLFLIVQDYWLIASLLWLSVYGILDYLFRERKSKLNKRCVPLYKPHIVITHFGSGIGFQRKMVKEFEYGGFCFRLGAFEKEPITALSNPLCRKCRGNLLEFVRVIFPFHISIRFRCNACDRFYKSKFTRAELIKQVAEIHDIYVPKTEEIEAAIAINDDPPPQRKRLLD